MGESRNQEIASFSFMPVCYTLRCSVIPSDRFTNRENVWPHMIATGLLFRGRNGRKKSKNATVCDTLACGTVGMQPDDLSQFFQPRKTAPARCIKLLLKSRTSLFHRIADDGFRGCFGFG